MKNQRGDTIVEVMIAMVVVGLTLSIGFRIANNALQTGRNASERTAAVKLAETQLEYLKAGLKDNSPDDYDEPTYCLLDPDTVETDLGNCVQGIYEYQINYVTGSVEAYKAQVTWTVPNSEQDGVVELYYRTYAND